MAFTDFDLSGRTAIVAGGAGRAGSAIARTFAQRGARVLAADCVQPEALPHGVDFFQMDLRADAEIGALMAHCAACFGRLDILVNAAYCRAADGEPSREAFRACMDVNVTGALCLAQAAAEQMRANGGSIIQLIPADGAQVSWLTPDCAAAASGAAAAALVRTLAARWTADKIRVNAIALGPLCEDGARAEPGRLEEHLRFTPLGRLARPEDAVGAAVYLASDASSYTSGHVLTLDGGHHAY